MQKRKRTLSIAAVLILLVAATIAVAAFAIPTARELLLLSMETTETITNGHLVAEFEMAMPEQEGMGTLEAWGKLDVGPNGEPAFRVEVLSADEADLVGITAVSDGAQFWLWNPSENKVLTGTFDELKARMEAEHAQNDFDPESFDYEGFGSDFNPEDIDMPETPEESVDMLLEYFNANRTRRQQIGGDNAYTVRLVPIPEQMPEEVRAAGGFLNIWIRVNDTAPLGIEYAEGAVGYGKVVATTLELNDGVDEALFTFQIPAGAEVVNAADLEMPEKRELVTSLPADFEALTPGFLPNGAQLDESLTIRGAVVQRYALGDGGFSVAQGPAGAAPSSFGNNAANTVALRGVDARLFTDETGDRTLLTWVENDVTFWIGGDLTAEQAVAIAESLN